MRPLYESEQNRLDEREAARKIALRKGWQIQKLPMQYRLDYALVDHAKTVKAFLEVKRRHNLRAKYDTFMISLSKYTAALHLTHDTGVPCWFAVQWDDSLELWRVREEMAVQFSVGGRVDRNDSEDIEPVVLIPVSYFKQLKEAA